MRKIVAVVVILIGIFTLYGLLSINKLNVLFDRVGDLEIGARVYQKGLIVGKVENLQLLDNGVLADIRLDRNVKIPVGSAFTIKYSLLGGYVEINPSATKFYFTSKDTIVGHENQQQVLEVPGLDSVRQRRLKRGVSKIVSGVKDIIADDSDSSGMNGK